jgi:PIN domain nuclease of toxin-antitoxin system
VFVPNQRTIHRIDPLPLAEALGVVNLPPLHNDPFDRMLICQAIAGDLVLLTPDPAIRRYPRVRTDW